MFAVQPKLDLAWMHSRATFHDKMFALADRRLRGGGAPLVQRGADDVFSHLRGPTDPHRPVATARDLVTWPEDIGLFAALTGQRAVAARSSGSLTNAIASLLAAYAPQNGYYAARFPEVAARTPQVRLLALSLTDTFGRTAVETFSEMARRYHVWLEAGVDMAQRWKVVCDNMGAFNSARPARLPDGERCSEQNPAKVALLGDPGEPARDYAYEAVSPKPSNMALVFDPLGRLRSKQVKTYLTPTELPGQLDLVPGEVSRGLHALRTPVGTLGFVTSKDSWMPDVQDRLDQQHVDVLLQPEFFVNDVVADPPGMWAPDTMLASGYSDLLRLPSIETVVEPDTDGNIFEFSADAQSHIGVKPHGARGARRLKGHFVGQPDHAGLANVMRWVVRDPIRRGEPFPARRRRLRKAGDALLPGSGVKCPDPRRAGACENGQVEGVLWRDIAVNMHPSRHPYRGQRVRTRFSRSQAVAASGRAQRNAAVALRGRLAVVAFEERRGAHDRVLVVRSVDGGGHWSQPVEAARRRGSVDEWWPSVAIGARRRVTVAWDDDSTGIHRAYFARSGDGARTFGAPRRLDSSGPRDAAQWRPSLAPDRGDTVHAVFVDERSRSSDDALPQAHVYYTRIVNGRPGAARRLDGGTPASLAAKLDNSWVPRVAVRGSRVLATWIDFVNYDWGVFARESSNRGATFGPQRRVTDNREGDPSAGKQQEELADSPDPVLAHRSGLIAFTDWRKRNSAANRPHQEYDIRVAGASGGRNRQVDSYGRTQASTFAPSACPAPGGAYVVFQDAGTPQSRIRLVHVRRIRRRGHAIRVDDGGTAAGDSWRPRLACSGRQVLVVWETERDGPNQIYAAFAPTSRLP